MMPMSRPMPRSVVGLVHALGQVVHHRKVDERLAAEERDRQLLRVQLVDPGVDPLRNLRAGLERHPLGVLVVVAVVSLEAVVAREIALQRRQNRDAQLLGVFAGVRKELVQRLPVGLAARDDEPVLGQRDERLPVFDVQRLGPHARRGVAHAIEQRGDVGRHHELRVRQRVHQEHIAAIAEGNANVELGWLHSLANF